MFRPALSCSVKKKHHRIDCLQVFMWPLHRDTADSAISNLPQDGIQQTWKRSGTQICDIPTQYKNHYFELMFGSVVATVPVRIYEITRTSKFHAYSIHLMQVQQTGQVIAICMVLQSQPLRARGELTRAQFLTGQPTQLIQLSEAHKRSQTCVLL